MVKKETIGLYTTLAFIIATAVVTVIDYRNNHKLATEPYARPDAFTAQDGRDLHSRINSRIDRTEQRCAERVDKLHRKIEQQQSQILHIYEEVYRKRD